MLAGLVRFGVTTRRNLDGSRQQTYLRVANLLSNWTRCDDVGTRKLRNIDVCSTSRLLDLSLMQINPVSSISRGRKELLQADLVRPPSSDVGCAQKWSASMDVAIVFNRDEQQIAEAMRDSASPAILRRSVMGSTADRIKDIGPQPQSFDIERATKENTNYRSVAWSGRYLQVTLMSIPAGGDIGLEAHPETDQFLRLDAGSGRVQMGAAKDKLTFEKEVSDGWCVLVPAGTWHNITNIGATPMQVYAIYAPAHHTPDKVQATAAAAEADKDDEPAAWSVQPKHAPDKHG